MQLMIKPTSKCNFRCSFCSAGFLNQKDQIEVDEKLIEVINKIDPDNIIITGGDPLLVPVKYFNDLLSINDKITLSLTSNLWDFYLHPDKWIELFKNPRVGICTSFQFGSGRIMPNGKPYDVESFKTIMNLFNEKIGYMPPFISVISSENESMALDHVYLAKELGTVCRLNGQYPMGRSDEYYPRYKLVELYNKIIELGLEEYETNTADRKKGICPFNTEEKCSQLNRALKILPDGEYVYGYCEDLTVAQVYYDSLEEIPSKDSNKLNELINPEKCLYCKLYNFCNGCKLHRRFAKTDKNYCENMIKYADIIEENGFKL